MYFLLFSIKEINIPEGSCKFSLINANLSANTFRLRHLWNFIHIRSSELTQISSEVRLQHVIKLIVELLACVSSCISTSTDERIEGERSGKFLVPSKDDRLEASEGLVK